MKEVLAVKMFLLTLLLLTLDLSLQPKLSRSPLVLFEVQDLFPFYLDDKLLEMMKPSGPNCSDPMPLSKTSRCSMITLF